MPEADTLYSNVPRYKVNKLPHPFLFGFAVSFVVSAIYWWLLLSGYVEFYFSLSVVLLMLLTPFILPITAYLFMGFKYRNGDGIGSFIAGELVMLSLSALVFGILAVFAAVFGAATSGM